MNSYYDYRNLSTYGITTVMATTTSEAARDVNALMSFSSGDQAALVEVLQDYFSSPDGPERDDWDNHIISIILLSTKLDA